MTVEPLDAARQRMLAQLAKHIEDGRVLAAMAQVPRERFVPDELRAYAYEDGALPIGYDQTISQPLIVAMMTEALEPRPSDHVLEVGTGSGYQAAVLSLLVGDVVTVERMEPLLGRARGALTDLGCDNVAAFPAGDTLGWPEGAPYDGIIVTAGAPHLPRSLVEQLGEDGRLVIPVGDGRSQELVVARKTRRGLEIRRLGPCGFVPLVGDEAWPEDSSGGFRKG